MLGKFICDFVPHSSVCHNFSILVLEDLVLDEALCSWCGVLSLYGGNEGAF